ncbi:MAG: DNA repair protein RecO [Lentisphaeria bacterium]|nr:DNA repair protein RecO [Lentisphaeria bacterium]
MSLKSQTDILSTRLIVLKKVQYSNTSLIISGLTYEHGHQQFILKGVLKQNRKNFPVVDLFRELTLQYRISNRSDLHSVSEFDLVKENDAIAKNYKQFKAAELLSKFVLLNTVAEPVPQIYEALTIILDRLKDKQLSITQSRIAFILSILDVHGLLPDLSGDEQKEDAMLQFLAYATDPQFESPEYDTDQLNAIWDWLMLYCANNHIAIPPGFEQVS